MSPFKTAAYTTALKRDFHMLKQSASSSLLKCLSSLWSVHLSFMLPLLTPPDVPHVASGGAGCFQCCSYIQGIQIHPVTATYSWIFQRIPYRQQPHPLAQMWLTGSLDNK